MRASLCLIVPALLLPHLSAAQGTPVISGTVTDTVGNPVEGVTVSLERSRDSWILRNITDAKGHYVLVGAPTDTAYNLVARRIGYRQVTRPNTKGKAGYALIVNITMIATPVTLDPLTVTVRKRRFAKQLATLTDEEMGNWSDLVTAADAIRMLRPFALKVRASECSEEWGWKWKVFVDSAQMDFSFDSVSTGRIPLHLQNLTGVTSAWQVLERVKRRDIESIDIRPCTDRDLPYRYRHSIWITTKRAYWLARKGRR